MKMITLNNNYLCMIIIEKFVSIRNNVYFCILFSNMLPLVTNNLKPTNLMGYNGVSLIMKEMNELSFNDRNYLTETTSYVSYDCNDCPSECDCTDSDCVMTS